MTLYSALERLFNAIEELKKLDQEKAAQENTQDTEKTVGD